MTNDTGHEPTLRGLMDRIDEMEAKLAPPPAPTMNDIIRQQIAEARESTTRTMAVDALFGRTQEGESK